MTAKSRQLPDGCISLDGAAPLISDGEAAPELAFEREIGLTGEYKTRKFALARKQFEEVIANHKASGVDPAVDREHESWSNSGTEARGWVRELSIRPSTLSPGRDALVAKIELNDLGRVAVDNKHFRYLSMGIDLKGTNRMTGEPLGAVLDHLALVKRPFIEGMQPLSLSADQSPEKENHMLLTLKALGLKDDATDAEALSAVNALGDLRKELLSMTGADEPAKAIGILVAFKESHAQVESLKARIADAESKDLEREFTLAIDAGLKSGKLSKHLADEWAGKELRSVGRDGLKTLNSYLEKAPQMVKVEELREPAPKAALELSAEEQAYCERYGIDPQAMAATKAKKAAAV